MPERYIRIRRPAAGRSGSGWRLLPNGDKVPVFELSGATAVDDADGDGPGPRMIFHIRYLDGIARGCRVTYLGEEFRILRVSDSSRLRGLELLCMAEALTGQVICRQARG